MCELLIIPISFLICMVIGALAFLIPKRLQEKMMAERELYELQLKHQKEREEMAKEIYKKQVQTWVNR